MKNLIDRMKTISKVQVFAIGVLAIAFVACILSDLGSGIAMMAVAPIVTLAKKDSGMSSEEQPAEL